MKCSFSSLTTGEIIAALALLLMLLGSIIRLIRFFLKRRTDKKVAKDYAYVVGCLKEIVPKVFLGYGTSGGAYSRVFPDQDLRVRIEIYLGTKSGAAFYAKQLSQDVSTGPSITTSVLAPPRSRTGPLPTGCRKAGPRGWPGARPPCAGRPAPQCNGPGPGSCPAGR